jgi:hypothetical protein
MPDISMCMNRQCPRRGHCYRYLAPPNPYRQSYAKFDELECKDMIELHEGHGLLRSVIEVDKELDSFLPHN